MLGVGARRLQEQPVRAHAGDEVVGSPRGLKEIRVQLGDDARVQDGVLPVARSFARRSLSGLRDASSDP